MFFVVFAQSIYYLQGANNSTQLKIMFPVQNKNSAAIFEKDNNRLVKFSIEIAYKQNFSNMGVFLLLNSIYPSTVALRHTRIIRFRIELVS